MNQQARDTLAAARVRVVQKHPYLASALFNLRPVEIADPGVMPTMAVNDGWQLAYNPERVQAWGSQGTAAVLVHEIQHLLRDHTARYHDWKRHQGADARAVAITGDADAAESGLRILFNVAGDAEINDDVEAAGWKLPTLVGEKGNPEGAAIRAKSFGSKDGLTAEEYADLLLKQSEEQPKVERTPRPGAGDESGEGDGDGDPMPGPAGQKANPNAAPGCGGTCGNTGGNEKWEKKLPEDAPERMSGAEAEVVKLQVAHEINEHVRRNGRGTVPLGLMVWAEKKVAPPKIDWRRRLRSLVRNAVALASGADDYSHTRISKRSLVLRSMIGDKAPLMPALRRPVPTVKVVLDTSGSMGGGPLEMALSEVMGVVKAVGAPCEVIAVDAAVHAVRRVAGANDLKHVAVGGGGTDMRVGITRADNKRTDVIVVLTDGYTPWPDPEHMPRKAKLVAVVIGDTSVPGHIKNVVRVEEK